MPSSDIEWSASTFDQNYNMITVGHMIIAPNQIDVLVTKRRKDGLLLWEKQFGVPDQNNYGVAVITRDTNIYVIAASQSILTDKFDYLILRIGESGNLVWDKYFNGSSDGDDIPTALTEKSDYIYVTGSSYDSTNQADYTTLKLDAINGNILWEERYDYASLDEFPVAISLNSSGHIIVTGGSATSVTDWDIATIKYSPLGTQLQEFRLPNTNLGFDQPTALVKDNFDNYYITGSIATTNGSTDIYTIKLDNNFNLIWSTSFDGSGLEDIAYDIKLEADSFLYICGSSQLTNLGKDMVLIKYDINGQELWRQRRPVDNFDDAVYQNEAIGKKIAIDGNNDIFVVSDIIEENQSNIVVTKYGSNGQKKWESGHDHNIQQQEKTNAIHIDNNQSIYVTGVISSANSSNYLSFKLEEYERNLQFEVDSVGDPTHASKEVIIRFNPNIINTSFVDDGSLTYGTVGEVITDPNAILAMQQKLNAGRDFSNWKVIKIFHRFNTSITSTTARNGDIIPVPKLWSAMILKIGNQTTVEDAIDGLNEVSSDFILYAESNSAVSFASPNDPLYTNQQSLKSTTTMTSDINVEPAWDIIDNSPTPWDKTIRVGIIDSGMEYDHEDFTCPNTICQGLYVSPTESSVFHASWDFDGSSGNPTGASLNSVDYTGHGTRVAGIIGALRNNNKGIAGIAGGDMTLNVPSVEMYSFRLHEFETSISLLENLFKSWEFALNSPAAPLVDILNHSLIIKLGPNSAPNILNSEGVRLVREVYSLLFKAGIIIVNARGNAGNDQHNYPATIREDWSISVGGSGNNGMYLTDFPLTGSSNGGLFDPPTSPNLYTLHASYGKEMDLIAPAAANIIKTIIPSTLIDPQKCYFDDPIDELYNCFSATSAATPHVVGVAALLLEHYEGQVLSIEDIENILELSATDIIDLGNNYSSSYDLKNGWGRLNAGKALELIDENHDNLKVIHVDVHGADITAPLNCDDSIDPNNTNCLLDFPFFENAYESTFTNNLVPYGIFDFGYGYGFPKTHTANFSLNLCDYGGDSNTDLAPFVDINKKSYWVRNSDPQVNLWGASNYTTISGTTYLSINPEDNIMIELTNLYEDANGCTIMEGKFTGYSFNIYSTNFTTGTFEEFPKPSAIQDVFSFSLFLENADNVLNEIDIDYIPTISTATQEIVLDLTQIRVFPNPTNEDITIQYYNNQKSDIHIDLIDTQGKVLMKNNSSKQSIGSNQVEMNLNGFPPGVYFCRIKTSNQVISKRFVKI